MINTEWKPVNDFEGLYEINNYGEVRSLDRLVFHRGNQTYHFLEGRTLKSRVNNRGYQAVVLSKEGKCYTKFIHRLMADAFLPNPLSKKYINHRDGVKTNNALENLEWVSHSENMKHAYALGLIKPKKQTKIHSLFKISRIYRSKSEREDVQTKEQFKNQAI